MAGRDIVVIGASAGGLAAFRTIVSALPADLPAALFVVQHMAASAPSLLPELLGAVSPLAVRHPGDGEAIRHGSIYVAPPDHHLVIQPGHVHLVRGPKENGFRPAIDATFRSAASAYGQRVIGVVLTGMLDDGTAGLLAIKRHRGLALVQEPRGAAYPSMPESACRYVDVDIVCPLAEIAPVLIRLVQTDAGAEEAPMDDHTELEVGISNMERAALEQADRIGTPSPFSCPDCGGVLAEYYQRALEAGATGDVLKRSAAASLISAMRAVGRGEIYLDPAFGATLAERVVGGSSRAPGTLAALSEREGGVLRLIAQGYSNKEIAAQLDLSVKTVETDKARAMEKLNLGSRVDIVRYATAQGWLGQP